MLESLRFNYLANKFHGFIFKDKVLEICGLNPETLEYIVIDDGCCRTEDGWTVVKYRFKDLESAFRFFLSDYKHPNEEWDYVERVGEDFIEI